MDSWTDTNARQTGRRSVSPVTRCVTVSARRVLSSAEKSVGRTTLNLGTRPAGRNVYQVNHPATESAQPEGSSVAIGARTKPGGGTVTDPVFTTGTPAMESVRTTHRAAAKAILRVNVVFLMISPGHRIITDSVGMNVHQRIKLVMEIAQKGISYVEKKSAEEKRLVSGTGTVMDPV